MKLYCSVILMILQLLIKQLSEMIPIKLGLMTLGRGAANQETACAADIMSTDKKEIFCETYLLQYRV